MALSFKEKEEDPDTSTPSSPKQEKVDPIAESLEILKRCSASIDSDYIKQLNQLKFILLEAGIASNSFPMCPISNNSGPISKLLKEGGTGFKGIKPIKAVQRKDETKGGSPSSPKKKAQDWDDIWGDDENEEVKETYATPDLFFGRTAKDKFWDMFKYFSICWYFLIDHIVLSKMLRNIKLLKIQDMHI